MDSACNLAAGQSTGIFGTESGAVSKTTYIANEAYTFEMMTDTYGDGANDTVPMDLGLS
jgi:hypothetical protein